MDTNWLDTFFEDDNQVLINDRMISDALPPAPGQQGVQSEHSYSLHQDDDDDDTAADCKDDIKGECGGLNLNLNNHLIGSKRVKCATEEKRGFKTQKHTGSGVTLNMIIFPCCLKDYLSNRVALPLEM
jgi:hypothetical protein